MSSTLDELEETVSAAIASIDPAPFRLIGNEVFRETDLPLTASVSDSVLQSHLAFSVSVESAPVRDDGHLGAFGIVTVEPVVAVVFLYRLRTDNQKRDLRNGAIPAAQAVLSAVLAPTPLYGRPLAVETFAPQAMEGEFLPIRQTYKFLTDIATTS